MWYAYQTSSFCPYWNINWCFYALIHSYLRYGILVWGNASNSSLEPLKALINKAIRIISFCPSGNINLSQIYKELNLLNFENVLDLEYAKFIFKEKKGLLPTQIGNFFSTSTNFCNHAHNTRVSNSSQPQKLKYRLKSSEKSVQYNCSSTWDNLPTVLKCIHSFNLFKKNYKKLLIAKLN